MYYLIWKNEIVDDTDDKENAEYLRTEYTMAYQDGIVSITKRPTKRQLSDWND